MKLRVVSTPKLYPLSYILLLGEVAVTSTHEHLRSGAELAVANKRMSYHRFVTVLLYNDARQAKSMLVVVVL